MEEHVDKEYNCEHEYVDKLVSSIHFVHPMMIKAKKELHEEIK